MMVELARAGVIPQTWQVFHICGEKDSADLRSAYQQAGVPAAVETFCDRMGLAWRSASLAITRAGASTVAEAWANATPTIFFPYPYHKDQHQRLNAQPLVATGGARMLTDLIEPDANVTQIAPILQGLISTPSQRHQMIQKMLASRPADGATVVAGWIAGSV